MAEEQERYKGYVIKFEQDEDAQDPLKEFDGVSKFVCWHSRYNLGNVEGFAEPSDFQEWVKEQGREIALIKPLYMYDHSGIGISTSNAQYPFNCPWDAGQVGYVYMMREDVIKEWGRKIVTRKVLAAAEKCMNAEVETYNAFLSGDVLGWIAEDARGEQIESCCGYYGYDDNKQYMLTEARNAIDYHIEEVRKRSTERRREEARRYNIQSNVTAA